VSEGVVVSEGPPEHCRGNSKFSAWNEIAGWGEFKMVHAEFAKMSVGNSNGGGEFKILWVE
jgi:hypothetical protein